MVIKLGHLKEVWSDDKIKYIQNYGFCIANESFLGPRFSDVCLDFDKRVVSRVIGSPAVSYVNAVWTDRPDKALEKQKEHSEYKHIFISEICDVAVEEYATVCSLLAIKKIFIMTDDKEFYKRSEKLLSTIPNVKITGILYISNKPVIKK